jgi:hypothetical protein
LGVPGDGAAGYQSRFYKLLYTLRRDNLSLCEALRQILALSFWKIIIFEYRNIFPFSDYQIHLGENQSLFWKGRDR